MWGVGVRRITFLFNNCNGILAEEQMEMLSFTDMLEVIFQSLKSQGFIRSFARTAIHKVGS
jgi:ribosomal protein S8